MARSMGWWLAAFLAGLLAWWSFGVATRDSSDAQPRLLHSRASTGAAAAARTVDADSLEAVGGPSRVVAARALLDESRRLQACARLLALSEPALEAEERRIGAGFEELARARGVAYDLESARREIDARIAARLTERRECGTLPPATVASWWDRLERAALAGDPIAMEDYGSLVVRASDDADGVFAQIDEMGRRKKLAYGFLRQLAAKGHCSVSGHLERLAPDATTRYAFALVSVEMTRRFNDRLDPELTAENMRFMQSQADRAGAGLDVTQVAEARRLASQVIAACRDP